MFEVQADQTELKEFFDKPALSTFGVFTDLHLNPKDPHGRISNDISLRYADKLKILENIISFFNNTPVDFVINAGDTFHHPRIAERFKADYLIEIKKSKRQLLTLVGNHDSSSFDHIFSSVKEWGSPVHLYNTDFPHFIDTATIVQFDKFYLSFVPYTVDINGVKAMTVEPNMPHVCFVHNEIAGKAPEGFPLSMYSQIKAEDLAKKTYFIFGHYHTPTLYTENIHFAGACARNDFGSLYTPGVSIFKILENGRVENRFILIKDRDFIKATVDCSSANTVAFDIINEKYMEEDIVHIVLAGNRDNVNKMYSIAEKHIKSAFSMSITKEYDTVIKSSNEIMEDGKLGVFQIMEKVVKDNADESRKDALMDVGRGLLEGEDK